MNDEDEGSQVPLTASHCRIVVRRKGAQRLVYSDQHLSTKYLKVCVWTKVRSTAPASTSLAAGLLAAGRAKRRLLARLMFRIGWGVQCSAT